MPPLQGVSTEGEQEEEEEDSESEDLLAGSGPPSPNFASWSERRARLTLYINPGSLDRCGESD